MRRFFTLAAAGLLTGCWLGCDSLTVKANAVCPLMRSMCATSLMVRVLGRARYSSGSSCGRNENRDMVVSSNVVCERMATNPARRPSAGAVPGR